MEYRLVKNANEYKIFDEASSEIVGKINKKSRFLIFSKYVLDFEGKTYVSKPNFLTRRKWNLLGDAIKFRWKLFGKGVEVLSESTKFKAQGFKRGKISLKDENGRTGLIIDLQKISLKNHVLIEHYDRFSLQTSFIGSVLILERYGKW